MMTFDIRYSKCGDSELYYECFKNDEFVEMLCSTEKVDINEYLCDSDRTIRIIISLKENNNDTKNVGFAQFEDNGGDCFTIIGGLLPMYFNSGLGLFCAVGAISFFFNKFPNHTLLGGVFFHNYRSIRMNDFLGFKKIREQNQRHIFQLTRQDFNNPFVNKIKEMMEIQIAD